MKNLLTILILSSFAFYACEKEHQIVQAEDLQPFLSLEVNKNLQNINDQISFWSAKEEANSSAVYKTQLAGLYSSKYKLDGNVNHLHKAQNLLEEVNEFYKGENPGILRMLAANSISQHQFQKAYDYVLPASKIKNNQYGSKLVLFDACMELGYFTQAEALIAELYEPTNFDYKVRLSKWYDHVGNLDQAVEIMEQAAFTIAPNNTELKIWTLSNLADMYGHQGEVEKAYQAYLDVLALDSNYYYALKGIAYIAYANDKNLDQAKTILTYLDRVHPVPDYKLQLAEIAAYERDQITDKVYTQDFYAEVSKPAYGEMYNKYILEIDIAEQRFDKALALASKEVEQRATPQTYDLLAWTYFKSGNATEALKIAQAHVEQKTFEPDASYHLGVIYKQVDSEKSDYYLKDALGARFELGPNTSKEIENAISNI